MSDNEESPKKPPATSIGALNFLANQNPIVATESQEEEPIQNRVTENDNKDDDLNNEASDRKTDDFINELQSESMTPDDSNMLSRQSVTSGRLISDQDSSTPNINDPLAQHNNQGPRRSMSESALIDHQDPTEQVSTLPMLQDERSINDDDASSVQEGKTNNYMNNDDIVRLSSATKADHLDETTHFTAGSPKPSTSRMHSVSSKKSQPIVTGNEKPKQTDETRTDAEGTNHEKPSSARSEAPTADESRQTATNIESQRSDSPLTSEQVSSSARVTTPQTTKTNTNVDQSPRSSSAMKSKFNDNKSESSTTQLNNDFLATNEQADLIKQGEQIHIPKNDNDDEQVNNSVASKSIRKDSTSTSLNKEKIIDGDAVSSKSQRSSISSQQKKPVVNDQKSNLISNRRESNASEQKLESSRQSAASERKSIIQQNSSDQQEKNSSSKPSTRKSSAAEQQPNHLSRHTSASKQERISSTHQQQSTTPVRSGQHSRTNSNVATPIRTGSKKSQKNEKPSATTESDSELANASKLSRANSTSKQNESRHSTGKKISSSSSTTPKQNDQPSQAANEVSIPPLDLTDDEIRSSRLQSPSVEQLAEHNPLTPNTKMRIDDEEKSKTPKRSLHRGNSAESLNYIPLVDDESIDSASDANIGSGKQKQKQKRIKSKTIDAETNTDQRTVFKNDTRHIDKRQQESTPQKPMKATKSISNQYRNNRHLTTTTDQASTTTTLDTDRDMNTRRVQRSNKKITDDKDPVNVNVTVLVKNLKHDDSSQASPVSTKQKPQKKQDLLQPSAEFERHTQSDTEQIITDKQRKRRRPKRISRTTQTYECVFRRMEREDHEELRPTNDTDKNIQTRRSQLCPRSRSPKKYTAHLSTEAFKIEEILPKQFPQSQRNTSKTAMVARSISPQNGKLLILRPTLPFHHTDAVNVQRICLQYAIDLIPSENKSNDSPYGQRNKINNGKQPDQISSLPMIRSSSSLTENKSISKTNTKDKTVPSKVEDRAYQRKNGGAV